VKLKIFILALGCGPALVNAANIGWAIPKSVLQEGNVLHVEFEPSAPKQGLPSCATRTYFDITTEAGKVRASIALTAFASNKEVYAHIQDGLTNCGWASSVPNLWIRVRN